MSRQHDEQTIALAALFQSAALVDQIATRGMVAQNNFESSIYSVFVTNPKQTEDIFGGTHDLPYNLSLGLRNLQDLVERSKAEQNRNVTNYALSMIHLERKLSANSEMMKHIGNRLNQIREQARYFNSEGGDPMDNPSALAHPSVVANLASLYQETLSTFKFRIQVGGDPRLLQNSENAAKIRALLLAGIRAAMLWRQVGGKRWHLLFFRSRLRPSLKKIKQPH
ncbi:high frequency lysogenization protein HflD [Marinobacterium arenosum]|uniref:high frequency lysogenization protein HflD n=1 Tax=Marinobacterium arenosum TaxID=2862496 RepID=UPI001C96EC1E|nr:high frequency lysogenization protein HflD [Marinobacterium arenosum]MBY4677869.1 high frequency lysogenization protein HflD [Marinobacterium arenosum]